MKEEPTKTENVNYWMKHSVNVKLVIIIALMLLLLIPAAMIESIIAEREHMNKTAAKEVNSKWAESQQINGPVLTIPLVYEYEKEVTEIIDKKKVTEMKKWEVRKLWHILPEDLNISGNVDPKKLKRGIYEIVVYKSDLSVNGKFIFNKKPEQDKLKAIKYDDAFLTIGISDLRGIKEDVIVRWSGKALKATPGSKISDMIYSGVTVQLPNLEASMGKATDFEFKLNLQGSENLSFTPIGSNTNVEINSNWPAPSFNGAFLPDNREITTQGFKSNWKVLQLNRNFPQTWVGTGHVNKMKESAFGVDLILPLDDYQKSMRSAKYAVMTIALTFLIFFLVEIMNGRKIHPFQYALVGLALCLFYVLLVSISEHSDFNLAYGISTAAIVSMISLYSLSVFKVKKLTLLLLTTLIGIYGFLFVTLQLEDYALLMGSIGLTIILAATMYFTRNINWYKLVQSSEE